MNKLIFSALFLFAMLSGYTSYSQKIVSKISKEICNCLGNYSNGNVTTSAEVEAALESCIMKSSLKHIESIRKELGIDMTEGEVAGRRFGEIIAYELIRKCDIFLKYIMLLSVEPEENDSDGADATVHNPDMLPYEHFSVDTMSVKPTDCQKLHNAKYTYQNETADKIDYFIIDGKNCTEYHDNGTFVSHYTIRWKNDCEYESTFVESNNPEINNLLEKGDKVSYRILGVYGQDAYIQLGYKGFSKTFKMLIEKK
jgi:hypothetical protein